MATAKSPLTQFGYNLVAWPKTDIVPLLLLYQSEQGVSSLEAGLRELFGTGDAAPPQVKKEIEAADIKGSATLTFEAKGGVKLLDWLLNKLKMGKLSAGFELNEGYEVAVSYSNVRIDSVNLLDLDTYLSASVPKRERLNTFRKKLENNELFVINSIAKSNDISILISDKNGQDVNLDASVKGIVEANGSFARKRDNSVELSYKAENPLVFAFKAQQIIYQKKRFWSNQDEKFYIRDQQGSVLFGPEDIPTNALKTGEDLVDI